MKSSTVEKDFNKNKVKRTPSVNRPLMEKEDYTEFVKLFNPKSSEDLRLARFAFDIWKILRKVIDLLGPYAYIFMKSPKLMLAYQLLTDVVKEKTSELKGMKKEAEKLTNIPDHWILQDVEDYCLDNKINIKNLNKNEILNIAKQLRSENAMV